MMRRRPCRPHCGCGKPTKPIVHPVKENVVHCCTEENVQHVHPSHTTVKNHHVIKNEHVYPHSTSVENTCEEVNVNNGNNQVAGAMHQNNPMYQGNHMPQNYPMHQGNHMQHHGMKNCHKPHGGKPMHHGMKHGQQHNKWC